MQPDAIVIDVTMSDVSPRSLVRFVQARGQQGFITLVATAAGLNEAAGRGLLQEGFDAYLCKPFEVRCLVEILEARANAAGTSEATPTLSVVEPGSETAPS
jgi:CheY-like chemotaxis protein